MTDNEMHIRKPEAASDNNFNEGNPKMLILIKHIIVLEKSCAMWLNCDGLTLKLTMVFTLLHVII